MSPLRCQVETWRAPNRAKCNNGNVNCLPQRQEQSQFGQSYARSLVVGLLCFGLGWIKKASVGSWPAGCWPSTGVGGDSLGADCNEPTWTGKSQGRIPSMNPQLRGTIQQLALIGSRSPLHSEACNALGPTDGIIHCRTCQEEVRITVASNTCTRSLADH